MSKFRFHFVGRPDSFAKDLSSAIDSTRRLFYKIFTRHLPEYCGRAKVLGPSVGTALRIYTLSVVGLAENLRISA